jgi:hypothetical protein
MEASLFDREAVMNEDVRYAKFRRAPSGQVYVVWYDRPLCDADGGLRYFNTEDDARQFLGRCDLAGILNMVAA